jgi:hypothetical protein
MAQHALQSSGMPAHHVDSRSSTTHCLCTSVPTHSELSSWQRRATSTDYDRRMTSPHVRFGDKLADALSAGASGPPGRHPWGDILARRVSAEQVAAATAKGHASAHLCERVQDHGDRHDGEHAAGRDSLGAADECGAGIGEPSAAHVGGDELAGVDEVSDHVVGAAFGDADHGGDVPEASAGFVDTAQQRPGVVGQEAPTSRGLTL